MIFMINKILDLFRKGCIIHGTSVPFKHNEFETLCHWCSRKYVYFWRVKRWLFGRYL